MSGQIIRPHGRGKGQVLSKRILRESGENPINIYDLQDYLGRARRSLQGNIGDEQTRIRTARYVSIIGEYLSRLGPSAEETDRSHGGSKER